MNKVQKLRSYLNLTQEELAEKLNITSKSIQRYERENYEKMDLEIAKNIAGFFAVPLDVLFSDVFSDSPIAWRSLMESPESYKTYYNSQKGEKKFNLYNKWYFIIRADQKTKVLTQDINTPRLINPVPFKKYTSDIYPHTFIIDRFEELTLFLKVGHTAIICKELYDSYSYLL